MSWYEWVASAIIGLVLVLAAAFVVFASVMIATGHADDGGPAHPTPSPAIFGPS